MNEVRRLSRRWGEEIEGDLFLLDVRLVAMVAAMQADGGTFDLERLGEIASGAAGEAGDTVGAVIVLASALISLARQQIEEEEPK